MTNTGGTITAQSGHYPFGENWYETASNKLKFTSYDRDTASGESGNDYAIFRSHIPRLGRFSAPDPVGGSIVDPQSLNRYRYASNDPIAFLDPLGLLSLQDCFFNAGGCAWWTWYWNFGADGDPAAQDPDWFYGIDASWSGDETFVLEIDLSRTSYERKFYVLWPLVQAPSSSGSETLREKLLRLLRRALQNAACAAMFDGLAEASHILDHTAIWNVDQPGGAELVADAVSISAAMWVASGLSPASTSFGILEPGGPWDGYSSVDVVVGNQFLSESTGAQTTILIHELLHVEWAGTPSLSSTLHPNSKKLAEIMKNCKTGKISDQFLDK